jgi:hypothetical protein
VGGRRQLEIPEVAARPNAATTRAQAVVTYFFNSS